MTDRPEKSTSVHPRRLTHRGHVGASALLFETGLLSLGDARRRALARWSPQSQVYRLPEGLLLTLPAPVTVRADQSPGLPFVAEGSALIPAPLTAAERRSLPSVPEQGSGRGPRIVVAPPTFGGYPDTLVRVRAGMAESLPLADLPTEDPADWLDLGDPEIVTVSALAEPPPPPLAPTPVAFDPRGSLGGIAPPPDARASVLKALEGAEGRRLPPPTPPPSAPEPPGFLQRLFRSIFGRDESGQVSPTPEMGRAADNLFSQASGGFVSLAALSQFIGRQQADYIKKSIELFEKGNLTDALRHAIPLGRDGNGPDLPPFLGVPAPRDHLTIRPGETSASSSFAFMPDLFAEMRRLYREAFEKLVAAGRIEEAAFVLAELLHENEEAVSFLERHGRLKLAAEMAEARRLPPGLVVRLWFLAKERERAVRFARRTRSYADAVSRLERGDADQQQAAKALRLLWANDLAEAGDYAAAIEAALPVPEARNLVVAWADRVIEMGGLPGARMRARKLGIAPEQADALRESALELLSRTDPAGIPERLAYADALSQPDPRRTAEVLPTVRALARAAIRAAGRDTARLRQTPTLPAARAIPDLVSHLLTLASSGPLGVDMPLLPAPPEPPALHTRTEPLRLSVDANDMGSVPVTDAVLLPDGRLLVALGEAGLRLTTADGRTLTYWNQPTHSIVLADSGAAAITVARRGPDVARLGKLDLATRRLTDWCDAPVSAFAPDYDGTLWFVQSGDSLAAIDVTFPGFFALWRISEFYGQTDGQFERVRLARDRDSLAVVVPHASIRDGGTEYERFLFTMPSLDLKNRALIRLASSLSLAVDASGSVSHLTPVVFTNDFGERASRSAESIEIVLGAGNLTAPLGPVETVGLSGTVPPLPLAVTTHWQAAAVSRPNGWQVSLVGVGRRETSLTLNLGWSERTVLHFSHTPAAITDALTIADDRGRVLTVDTGTGALMVDARIR